MAEHTAHPHLETPTPLDSVHAAGPVVDNEADDRTEEGEAALEKEIEALDTKVEKHEDAVDRIVTEILEARTSLRHQLEHVKNKDEREAIIGEKTHSLVSSFSESDQLKIVRRLLPSSAVESSRELFETLVGMGISKSNTSRDNLEYRYQKKFGDTIEKNLEAQRDQIYDKLVDLYPELKELGEPT